MIQSSHVFSKALLIHIIVISVGITLMYFFPKTLPSFLHSLMIRTKNNLKFHIAEKDPNVLRNKIKQTIGTNVEKIFKSILWTILKFTMGINESTIFDAASLTSPNLNSSLRRCSQRTDNSKVIISSGMCGTMDGGHR